MGEFTQGNTGEERTLKQYLDDVVRVDSQEVYPEYSGMRKRILSFWEKALLDGTVSLNDSVEIALKKMGK